jgi:serine/threonine protein kinase
MAVPPVSTSYVYALYLNLHSFVYFGCMSLSPPASAMTYMHSKHVAHCDLSLENVLVTASNFNVTIIDFGLGATTDGLGHSMELFGRRGGCGKANYLAPEVATVPRHPVSILLCILSCLHVL